MLYRQNIDINRSVTELHISGVTEKTDQKYYKVKEEKCYRITEQTHYRAVEALKSYRPEML